MVPFDFFDKPWLIFHGKDDKVSCVQNTCAHRACPLHFGLVVYGCVQCSYHGWEYAIDSVCEKMPSTHLLNVHIKSLPCVEQDGLIWVWHDTTIPDAPIPSLVPPSEFNIHSYIVMDFPIEHGLVLDNLLELYYAPFTHTTTFSKHIS